ncbi:hypothetical protein [Veillonella caviae]|uniref:hypothetical protein n=1 Tax=Veillonella caviae TaxID=248316 RepID=UPI002A7EE8CA|nr:hypothetical protein [Veillonella caviae]MDY4746991.1 hypothetical protein [Veillonella caviae]
MKLDKTYIGLIAFLLVALIAMFGAYRFVTNHQNYGPSIGVVRLDDVLEMNPSYEDYKLAKDELSQLQHQYSMEQMALNQKAQLQEEQLKNVALNDTLTDALNVELQTRIGIKEQELNQKLNAKRAELSAKYLSELKEAHNAYDLEIVNLQLDLYAFDSRIYIDEAQKNAADAEKAEKEARLKALLEKRKPSNVDIEQIQQKIQSELEPMKREGEAELKQYAETIQADLAKKRDTMMQTQVQEVMAKHNLPVPQEWNDSWAQRLSDKEAEVNALHDALLEDIRMRASVVANEQQLDLVLIDDGGNIKGLDITDAIKASYRVQ